MSNALWRGDGMDGTSERVPKQPRPEDDQAKAQPQPDVPITPVVPPDPNWYAKIQRARQAREAGIKLRKNKPVVVVAQYSPV